LEASLGRNNKSWWDRKTHTGHFSQPCPFASKEFFIRPIGLFKEVDIFQTFHNSPLKLIYYYEYEEKTIATPLDNKSSFWLNFVL
jgi:hypothetical protein